MKCPECSKQAFQINEGRDWVCGECGLHFRPKAALWQPIETAPKDGSTFLGFDKHRQAMFVAKWHHNYSDDEADGYWSNIVGDDDHCEPTHWQPLPEAPK